MFMYENVDWILQIHIYENKIVVCELSCNTKNDNILIFLAFILRDNDKDKNNDHILIFIAIICISNENPTCEVKIILAYTNKETS